MRHSQLRAFHHVALLGGFSRAAEALRLTQPAISEQVKKLEQNHDVLLFERKSKQVRLTEKGSELLRLTHQYFEIETQIGEFLSENRSAVDGTLHIIADSAHHVTSILTRFRELYPDVIVKLRTGNTEDVFEELRNYRADVGVAGSLTADREMDVLSLGETEIIAFAARGFLNSSRSSLTLEELSQLPLIFREAGSKTRQKLEDAAAARKLVLRPAIEAEGREAVRELVASGAGIGFVSKAEHGNDDRLVQIPLSGVDAKMAESIVCLSQRREVKLIRAFWNVARTHGD